MNRADFKRLAQLRVREANTLLGAGNYAGAYYLAGYAIECALKACIAKQTKLFDFPAKPEEVRDIYSHDLTKLLKPAGLRTQHEDEENRNQQFRTYWGIVKDWSEQSRYTAQSLYLAITDPTDGVLQWLKKYW